MKQKGFVNILLIIIFVALVDAGAYFVSTRQIAPPTPNLPTPRNNTPKIIKGHSSSGESIKVTLIHDKSNPHALNDNFVITNATHISVSLYYAPYTDGGSETILSQNFINVDKLPFLFEITGDLGKIFKERTGYYLSVEVFSHSGDEVVVGDLISEMSTPIASSDSNVEIKVLGIEECGSLNAGGYCTTKK